MPRKCRQTEQKPTTNRLPLSGSFWHPDLLLRISRCVEALGERPANGSVSTPPRWSGIQCSEIDESGDLTPLTCSRRGM